jgi:hypothetical protein
LAVRILFDQGTPAPLRHSLTEHEVVTAFERGWQALANGDLLRAAEEEGFEVFVTTDRNPRFQQDLTRRRLAFVVLMTTDWRRIRQNTTSVSDALKKLARIICRALVPDAVCTRRPGQGDASRRSAYEMYRTLDLGPGGYPVAPSTELRAAVRRRLKAR